MHARRIFDAKEMKLERVTMNCRNCQSAFPISCSIPAASSNAAVRGAMLHPAPACEKELKSLEATFALLDTWQVPEPSPYFDQKLAIRLREEQSSGACRMV